LNNYKSIFNGYRSGIIGQLLVRIAILLLLSLLIISCGNLDGDGGYYDEKTKTYKYVNPTKRGVKSSSLQVTSPTSAHTQQIQGIITRINSDAKSVWVKIRDRKPYMILAERLSGGGRNDKTKELKVGLSYVSPLGSVTRGSEFRKKWRAYAVEVLKKQLLGKTVFIETEYLERARKLNGVVYTVVPSSNGEKLRNMNLWMIYQGLSYYFIDQKRSSHDKRYVDAQKFAKHSGLGLWKYQR
jgi:hypothetical protein